VLPTSTARWCRAAWVGEPASCAVDGGLTQADETMVKVFRWYDNQWGYTNRLVDVTELIATEEQAP
jgi:glyceraldehyde 3-phosphate dehydrogenase